MVARLPRRGHRRADGPRRAPLPDLRRPRCRRVPGAGLLGRLHHHLRVLDRNRPRRHPDLGDPLPLPREVAQRHQPRRRGDDGVRGADGRALPADPHRPALEVLLPAALPEPALPLGELQEPAPLGRLRGQHLPDDLGALLHRRPDPRHRDRARSGRRMEEGRLHDRRRRLAGNGQAVEGAQPVGAPPLGHRDAAGALGPLDRVLGLRDVDRARAGTRRSSHPTSWPAPSSAASRWWSW